MAGKKRGALWFATEPLFQAEVASVRLWLGGSAEAHRQGLAHQVYAAYRRADPDALLRVLERARVYEPTVHEAAAAFGVDPEVLMGSRHRMSGSLSDAVSNLFALGLARQAGVER
jgi:hypothetical protein